LSIVAIDFETANEARTSACSIGLAWIENGRVTATEEHLIRPREMRFLSMNVAIHGIRPDDVRDAPSFAELWPDLAPRFDGALVLAHNASFDLSVLRYTLAESGLPWPACDYLCTVTLSRKAWPELPSHRLNTLAEHLAIDLDHHNAGSDARACAEIALAAADAVGASSVADLAERVGVVPGQLRPGGYTPCRGGGRRR
jgi:DNA polymerase III subunit epsilon